MARKEKDFRQFLKDQGLTKSFRTYRRIKKRNPQTLNLRVRNFDNRDVIQRVLVYRTKRETIFRNLRSMEVIGRSRKNVPDAIRSLEVISSTKDTNFVSKTGSKVPVKKKKITNKLILKFDNSFESINHTLGRIRKVTQTNKPVNKFGLVVADIEYRKQGIKSVRKQFRSSFGFQLNKQSEIDAAVKNAIRNGLGSGEVQFSPDEIIVHGYHREYFQDRRMRVAKVDRGFARV